MATTPRHNFFITDDANKALDEYATAFRRADALCLREVECRTPQEEAYIACEIRKAIRNKTPMTDTEILKMYSIKLSFFITPEANEALDEYKAAFGSAKVFYMLAVKCGPAQEEANIAPVIREAIRRKTRMTESEILNMYGIIKHNLFTMADANKALDEYEAAFGSADVFYTLSGGSYPPVAETNFARIIREAVSRGSPMSKTEILNMYCFDYEKGVQY